MIQTLRYIKVSKFMPLLLVLTPWVAAARPIIYTTGFCGGPNSCSGYAVAEIDGATDSVLGYLTFNNVTPNSIFISQDGTKLYLDVGSAIAVIDIPAQTLDRLIPVDSLSIAAVVDPTNGYLYATGVYTGQYFGDYHGGLYAIDVSNLDQYFTQITASIDLGKNTKSSHSITVSPDGGHIYVGNENNTVSVVDTKTETAVASINTSGPPAAITMSPDGRKAYVVDTYITDGSDLSGALDIIDTEKNVIYTTIKLGHDPYDIAISPNGSKAYVSEECYSANYSNCSNSYIAVYDTATWNLIKTYTNPYWGFNGQGMAISPDGTRLYVADLSDDLAVIDTTTGAMVDRILLSVQPVAEGRYVSIGPGALIAYNTSAQGTLGEQVSGSVAPVGNTTSCSVIYKVLEQPENGILTLNSSTGDWTYTPKKSNFSGRDSFTWRGEAISSSTCASADSPTSLVSNAAAVTITLSANGNGSSSGGGVVSIEALLFLGLLSVFTKRL